MSNNTHLSQFEQVLGRIQEEMTKNRKTSFKAENVRFKHLRSGL